MLTYKSNAQQVVLSLSAKLKATQDDMDKLLREVANNLYVENSRRIHNEGKDVNDKLIGQGKYSTKSTYISLSQSPKKFQAKGKSGNTKFKNGKPHKSGYFPNGYKQFRDTIGRRTSVVNLQLSGKLKTDFIIKNNGSKWLIGFEGSYGKNISEGLEEKYSQNIWGLSEEGKQQSKEIVERYINDHLK